jgi:hypothetical protein
MKKNLVLLLVVAVLAGLAYWLYSGKQSGTISEEMRDFAVKDTGSIVKIFMADKAGNQVLLEKTNPSDWTLNKKYLARPDAITTLLTTIHDVRVKSPVSKSAYNNIIKNLAATGVKVEIYDATGLVKTIYVGGPDPEQTGTFMYVEGAPAPFVTHIPGFEGYLTPRYFVREEDWRVKNVFRLNYNQLESLMVLDKQRQGFAFTIERNPESDFSMIDANGNPVSDISQDKVINYLQAYSYLNYEREENTLTPAQEDSLLATEPFRTIRLTEAGGKITLLELWRRPITERTVNKEREDGFKYPYDIDRMTGRLNNDTTLIVVQYFSFERLFRSPGDFLVNNPR